MRLDLKALGIVLGAVLALGALGAASASAQEEFHSEEDVALIGHGTDPKFQIKGIKITCETSTFDATFESSKLTFHFALIGCAISTLGAATVNTNGCDYVVTSEVDEHAEASFQCTEGSAITIAATGCTISIGSVEEETLADGVTYENLEGEPETLTVESTVTEIPYTSSGFLCGFAGIPSEDHDAAFMDDLTVAAYENEGCEVNSETHERECELGEEVGIWWE